MTPSESPKSQPDKPNIFGSLLRSIANFVKGSMKTLKLDEADTGGKKLIEDMKDAGIEEEIIKKTTQTRAAVFEASKVQEMEEDQAKNELEKEAHESLQEKYREKLPEGSEAKTKNIYFKDIAFKDMDVAVKEGKVIKLLTDDQSMTSSGGNFSQEELDKLLEPLQEMNIVLSSSGHEANDETEHLSEVKIDINRLNSAIEKGQIDLVMNDDAVEINAPSK